MMTNTDARRFDVIEVTNEMPTNRIGGVGTVLENLLGGLAGIGVRALWYLVDHGYRPAELHRALAEHPDGAVGTAEELALFAAPVAHLHSYNHNPALLAALGGRRLVFTVHSLLVQEERSNAVDLGPAVARQEAFLAASDLVVLVSEAERRHYRALGYERRANRRVAVVHNGLRPPGENVPARPRARRVLGYCGRLVPRKHPEYVQMILREPGFDACRTMIAGKGFSAYARDLLRDAGIEDRVDYLGWCGGPRLEAFYRAIDVLALPAVYEPFGMAALEAAARGIPVVCTRVDGLPEVLGEGGFYCDGTDYAAFHAAMWGWAAAPETLVAEKCAEALARHRTHFTDIAMARRYQLLFRTLAAA